MPLYRIRPGASFRMNDGSVQTAGAVIELGTDVATTHAGSVELIETPPAAQIEPVLAAG